jgi:hypothetical protein
MTVAAVLLSLFMPFIALIVALGSIPPLQPPALPEMLEKTSATIQPVRSRPGWRPPSSSGAPVAKGAVRRPAMTYGTWPWSSIVFVPPP